MPMSARRPSTMNSFLSAEVRQNSMAVQQRLQILVLQFDKLPTPSSFLCWTIRFKTQLTSFSDFPRLCCGSKKWRCGGFSGIN